MKKIVTIAKKSAVDCDGFLNGFFKGIVGSAATIIVLTFLTGFAG